MDFDAPKLLCKGRLGMELTKMPDIIKFVLFQM